MSNYETSATLSTNAGFEAMVSNQNQLKAKPNILEVKYDDLIGNIDILLAIIKHLTDINGPTKKVLGKLCDTAYRKFSFRQIKHQMNACLELVMVIYSIVDNEATASTLRKLVKLLKNITTSLDVFFCSIATVAKNYLQTNLENNIKLFHTLKTFDMIEFKKNLDKLKKKLNTNISKCQLKSREQYKLSLREVIPIFRLGALKFDDIINEEIRVIGYDHEKYVPKAENKSVKRKRGDEDSFEEDSEYQPSKVVRIMLYDPADDTSDSSSDEEDIPFTEYSIGEYSPKDNSHAKFVNEIDEVPSRSSTNEHISFAEHSLVDVSFNEHSNEIISLNKKNQVFFCNEIVEMPSFASTNDNLSHEHGCFADNNIGTSSANESNRATVVNREEPNDISRANHDNIFNDSQIASDRKAIDKANDGLRRHPWGCIGEGSFEKKEIKTPKNEFEDFKVQPETKDAICLNFSLTEKDSAVSNEAERPAKRKRTESDSEGNESSEKATENYRSKVLKRVRLALSIKKTSEEKPVKKAAIPTKRFKTLRRVATNLFAMKRNFMGGHRIGKRGTVYPVRSE